MSKSTAELLRLFSVGMFGYYLASIGMIVFSVQFAIVMASIIAVHYLGQYIGFVRRVDEEKEALQAGIFAAMSHYSAMHATKPEKKQETTHEPQN